MTCRPACGLYLLVGAPLCLAFLGQNDLIRMEPIVALGAEHMRITDEWRVPRLYGEIYAYKPSLAYWLVVEPRRAQQRSLRTVAAPFDPHLPADAVVYMDTRDSLLLVAGLVSGAARSDLAIQLGRSAALRIVCALRDPARRTGSGRAWRAHRFFDDPAASGGRAWVHTRADRCSPRISSRRAAVPL